MPRPTSLVPRQVGSPALEDRARGPTFAAGRRDGGERCLSPSPAAAGRARERAAPAMARALARRSAALCAAASLSWILLMYYFARRSISFSSLYFLYEDGGSREEPPCEGRFSP